MKTIVTFRLASGELVAGPVQGSGGKMSGAANTLDRLRIVQAQAKAGRRLGIYEPSLGCVSVQTRPEGQGGTEDVDLRTAEIVGAEDFE